MVKHNSNSSIVAALIILQFSVSLCQKNPFIFKSIRNCEKFVPPYMSRAICDIRFINKTHQVLNVTWYMKTITGPSDFFIEYKDKNPRSVYKEILSVPEPVWCNACNKYLGEVWYSAQRSLGMLPKACPISEGIYKSSAFILDLALLPFKLPYGYLRMTSIAYMDKSKAKKAQCIIIELENNRV